MSWLIENWHDGIPAPWANTLLCLVAVACGSIVGAERQKKDKPAGLRTLILVCVGSAVFTMVSISFDRGEPGHIAAQIVSGIGFLGAGAILRGTVGVTGMTTAASIWMVAAVGMVVGAGYAVGGLALSGLVLAILTVISNFEIRHLGSGELCRIVVVFEPNGGKSQIKIEDLLDEYYMQPSPARAKARPDGRMEVEFRFSRARRHHHELLASLASLPEVTEIHREKVSDQAS